MTAALEVAGLRVQIGTTVVVDEVSLAVAAGSVLGLIGPNGAGKTTLIDALSGSVAARGAVLLRGEAVHHLPAHRRARRGLARTFQSLELFEDLSVVEHLRVAAEATGRGGDVAGTLTRLGLDEVADRLPPSLSQAERKLLALGRAVAAAPEVLLLDEPAAGLDGAQREALSDLLRALAAEGTAVVLVDHDMGLVLGVCDRVCVLERGAVLACGTPEEVAADPRVVAAYLGARAPQPPTARGRAEGEPLLVAEGVCADHGQGPVLSDVSVRVAAGEVVALLGPNGAGKTTLLSALAGLLPPTAGSVTVLGGPLDRPERLARRGLTLLPQGRGLLAQLSARDNLRLARGGAPLEPVLQHFPDLAPLLDQRAGQLSGGQQQQLALARALLTRPRLLLVDELSLGLAPQVVDALLSTLRRVAAEQGTGVLLVEQHVPLALGVVDRAYVLRRGRVVLEGSAAEISARPDLVRASYLGHD